MGFIEDLLGKLKAPAGAGGKTPDLEPPPEDKVEDDRDEVLKPFEGSLERAGLHIPKNRTEVYQIFGRAPEEKNPAHNIFPKATMVTAKGLPGTWNKSSGKLYMLSYMESYLREALVRCEKLGVLSSIKGIGCYNFRHIRFDPNSALSYHSWGAAIDIDPSDNKPYYRSKKNIAPPFSKQWKEVYPNGMPFDLVLAFQSVGFTWGGDWRKSEWIKAVQKNGEGYDAGPQKSWPKDWLKVNYIDPMHFQLVDL